MPNENTSQETRVSNWTLATGTRPFERPVYPHSQYELPRPTPSDRGPRTEHP